MEDERRLYFAAETGDTFSFNILLTNDPLLLNRVSFRCTNRPPLHVATMHHRWSIVQIILDHNPQLAEQLDFQQKSALHIASANGDLAIVAKLLSAAPNMCLSRDWQGRNPVHHAAIQGHGEVLARLIQMVPLASRMKVDQGQTALHLCVNHRQLETLMILVPRLHDFIDARDEKGDTVLHIAVRDNQFEITEYLMTTNIDVYATNLWGQIARDISENSEMTKILMRRPSKHNNTVPEQWVSEKRDAIMVVAILIATMAFQAGVSPPGGVWQDNLTHDPMGNPAANPHRAGEAIMAYRTGDTFNSFIHWNTLAFLSCLSIILLLISGQPFRRNKMFLWILMAIMWVTVTSVGMTYVIAIRIVIPRKDKVKVGHITPVSIVMWCVMIVVVLVGYTIWLIRRWFKKRVVTMWIRRGELELINMNYARANNV